MYRTPLHRLRLVTLVYGKLFHIAFGNLQIIQVPYEGSTFRLPTQDITILPSLLNDCYEKAEIKILRNLLKPGMTFVDIGANVGIYSVLASRLVGDGGKIYAFEPEPRNFELLKENLVLNGISNVHLANLAVGNNNEVMALQIARNSIGSHSLLARKDVENEVLVNVVRLDDWFDCSFPPIDVLKIDVEGYEPFVLEGAQRLLHVIKFILFEYNKSDVDLHGGIAHLAQLLNHFPYFYRINERKGDISAVSLSDIASTRYTNILASRTTLNIINF